jgi:formylglycine-generating enzyme required for sulfatase activity/energy-coupling factor transporter ATP-binding protein EcfA2
MKICSQCGKELLDDDRFCSRCGARQGEAAPTSAPATAPASAPASLTGSGSMAQAGGTSAGESGVAVGGNVAGNVVIAKDGAQVFIGEQPIAMTAVQRESALGRYLTHIISRNRYLQLQGIRSGGKLVNIELESIYITLRATRTRTVQAKDDWLAREAQLSPGERIGKGDPAGRPDHVETVLVKVEQALAENPRLVVLGDPGSGKTTLLRYLALRYARDRAEGTTVVRDWLARPESGHLPLLVPLRNLGAYLKAHYPTPDGAEGHDRVLEFLRAYLKGERLAMPDDFFDRDLEAGRVALLLDGMDEVGDDALRQRVARLVEAFACAYPQCRVVVTSRVVGYAGAARLGEGFATTTVSDFTLADVAQFLTHWHRLIAVGQMGPGESAEHYAAAQTTQLMQAIKDNPRVRELAINPLMLTVIALVHRDRVKLPDRRAELYAEAVDVLLGKWDEARGVEETCILEGRPFDAGDRRLLLQSLALKMHAAGKKEIEADDLQRELRAAFANMTPDARAADRAVERFIKVIQERTGLLVEAGPGAYRFSHLTFQEYLAAVEMAERDDYVEYTLTRVAEAWWREVILLEAGYLSTKKVAKVTRLVRAIADCPIEPELFHNLVLVAECLRDVGPTRVEGDLAEAMRKRLNIELEQPIPEIFDVKQVGFLERLTGSVEKRKAAMAEQRQKVFARRLAAANALGRIESGAYGTGGQYWTLPHGEPKWITILAGEFWMGGEGQYDGKPVHRVQVDEFQIAITPITNGQYWLFVSATGANPPQHWQGDLPPKGKENHPVVYVSWHDALKYCEWLSKVTGKPVRLPTEAEWEKAARGDKDKRAYPWGDDFDPARCNSRESGIGGTSPVGIYPTGASPYGALDMAGNVWEWCQSERGAYPYKSDDGREKLDGVAGRVVRGGSWSRPRGSARCAFRDDGHPGSRDGSLGFRVGVVSAGSRS